MGGTTFDMKPTFSRNTSVPFTEAELRRTIETEWLVTNGLGGYASCSVSGTLTRVFHGYLIAALPSPLGRSMMLNDILEEVVFPDDSRVVLHGLLRLDKDDRGYAKHLA